MMKTLVLAAGKSTRIATVAGDQPKPLLQLAGESVLARNLRWLVSQGVREVWINLHYKPEAIQAAIGDGTRLGLTVHYVYEPEILGTAGAVRNLAPQSRETILVVYGDSLLRMDLAAFLHFHRQHGALASLALCDCRRHPRSEIASGRVLLDAAGRIRGFHEGADDAISPLVSAGVYLLEPELVAQIPAGRHLDFGHDLFPGLLAAGTAIYGHVLSGYCLGLDTPASYRRTIELVESGQVDLL